MNYLNKWLVFFDAQAWSRIGDVGDNSQFWKAAEVVKSYWKGENQIVDIRFIDSQKISRGHFLDTATSVTPYWQEQIDALA